MSYQVNKELKHYASRMHHYSTYRINKKGKPERPNNELNRWSNKKASYYISEVREWVREDEPDWDYYYTPCNGYWRVSKENHLLVEVLSRDCWDRQNPLGKIWVNYSNSAFNSMRIDCLNRTEYQHYLGSNLDYFDMITRAEAKLVLKELVN